MPKYKIIYADPPWQYQDKSKHRGGAERHYGTMSISDLKKMNVNALADDDCILLMWATFPQLKDAISLMEAWGFRYKTIGFNWVKRNKIADSWFWGMGNWTRSNSEICLIGIKGKPKRIGKGVHSVIDNRIMRHSKKPDIVRDKIVELCGDVPRLEMFAREKADGWDAFGDEIDGGASIEMNNNHRPIVIIESPYAGDVGQNLKYAREAMADSLSRGEAPYASHMQEGVLDDSIAAEREAGMNAGFEFSKIATKAVIYTDLGISSGMKAGIKIHRQNGLKIEKRKIRGVK